MNDGDFTQLRADEVEPNCGQHIVGAQPIGLPAQSSEGANTRHVFGSLGRSPQHPHQTTKRHQRRIQRCPRTKIKRNQPTAFGHAHCLAHERTCIVGTAVLQRDVGKSKVNRPRCDIKGSSVSSMHGAQRRGLAVMKHRFTTTLEKCGIDIRGIYSAESFTETSSHTTDTATDFHHGQICR